MITSENQLIQLGYGPRGTAGLRYGEEARLGW